MALILKTTSVPHKNRNRFKRNSNGTSIISTSNIELKVDDTSQNVKGLESRTITNENDIYKMQDQIGDLDVKIDEVSKLVGNSVMPFNGFVSDEIIEMQSTTDSPSPSEIKFDKTLHLFLYEKQVEFPSFPKYYRNWVGATNYNSEGVPRTDMSFIDIASDTVYHYNSNLNNLVTKHDQTVFPILQWTKDNNLDIIKANGVRSSDVIVLMRRKRKRIRNLETKVRTRKLGWDIVHGASVVHSVNGDIVRIMVKYYYQGVEKTASLVQYHADALVDSLTDYPTLSKLSGKCALMIYRDGVPISDFVRFRIHEGHLSLWQ